MSIQKTISTKKSIRGLFFPLMTYSGPENMAIDKFLLKKIIKEKDIMVSLRFYKWDSWWLSIGKHQREVKKSWRNLIAEKKLNIVKRPTGGGAVIHGGGLTYSIVWKPPTVNRREAYFLTSKPLINAFKGIGLPLQFGNELQNEIKSNCFSSSTQADLIDHLGNKRIGSAQLWENGYVLQHGEILVDPPKGLWREIFDAEAPRILPIRISLEALVESLTRSFMGNLSDIKWEEYKFSEDEVKGITLSSKDYLYKI